MFEVSWVFWILVGTLFAESWGRALARAFGRSAPATSDGGGLAS